MGCDIHIIAEVKENGKWKVNIDKVFKNSYFDPKNDYEPFQNEFSETPPGNRNYDWFSLLANVRNGYGFAGVKTGEGFTPIAFPKGVPKDATQEWKKNVEEWDCDMHSHSYLSLEEFKNFDWTQVTIKAGVISLEQYKKLKDTAETPDSWSGGISGGNIVTVDSLTADKILNGKIKKITKESKYGRPEETRAVEDWNIYVDYRWPILYSDWFENNLKAVVPAMEKLKEKYEDVRLVFGFDN